MPKKYEDATLVPDQEPRRALRIDDDEPIPLADACELFPRARLKVSTLRAEAARGRHKAALGPK